MTAACTKAILESLSRSFFKRRQEMLAADVLPSPPAVLAPSFAPNLPAGTWPASALPVAFVLGLPRSRDVGVEAAAELDVALRTWTRVACTGWRARYDGERAVVAADDGVNVILFHD